MKRSIIVAALLCAGGLPALADKQADTMASCMVTNSTDAQTANMKKLIVHALQEQKPEATDAMLKFSVEALTIATSQCGLTFVDIQTPLFENAMHAYAELLGKQILDEAINFMDIPVR